MCFAPSSSFSKKKRWWSNADVDLFYGVFLNDTSILEDVVLRGANVQASSGEITERYKHFLGEFKPRKNR
jgi:hypothetical protein